MRRLLLPLLPYYLVQQYTTKYVLETLKKDFVVSTQDFSFSESNFSSHIMKWHFLHWQWFYTKINLKRWLKLWQGIYNWRKILSKFYGKPLAWVISLALSDVQGAIGATHLRIFIDAESAMKKSLGIALEFCAIGIPVRAPSSQLLLLSFLFFSKHLSFEMYLQQLM